MRVSGLVAIAALAALAAALLMGPGRAQAEAECHASVTLVDFGRVEYPRGGDITGRLTVTCDRPTRFEVAASPGYGGYDGRRMRGPMGWELHYNLYVDPARRRVWGDGQSGGTARIVGQSDGRKPAVHTIYARIPDGQSVRPGPYRDAVRVSVQR